MLGVHQGHDAVEAEALLDLFVAEEGLRHRSGIGEARRLNENVVEAVPALEQLTENPDEIATNGAANAPVVHLEDFFVGADDQGVVDADLAKFILDHRDPLPVLTREDVVEESRLSGSEESGENGDRNAVVCSRGGHIQKLSPGEVADPVAGSKPRMQSVAKTLERKNNLGPLPRPR